MDDLTQFGFGCSMEDAEAFVPRYKELGIIPASPFRRIDVDGIGRLLQIACASARAANPDIEIGICGSQTADPETIEFAVSLGISYLSCAPSYVPIARYVGGQAAVKAKRTK
jgi:pyruvate,orthophosphate dikinase